MTNIVKALTKGLQQKAFTSALMGSGSSNGWWPWVVKEPFGGAWQQSIEWTRETVLAHHAVFSCTTLIAHDISKLRIGLVKQSKGIWENIPVGDFDVINNPNHYQNSIQFYENWLLSKTIRGNTFVLKGRDAKGVVRRLYILHPDLVTPMVSDSGDVFYSLNQDNLNGIEAALMVPASEIIHDRYNCLFHPLVGISPLFAAGLAAYAGLKIQENNAKLFKNSARPNGVLTAPGNISDETAARVKESWETNYGGDNLGRTAVLGDDLKYQPIAITAVDSQMIEQVKMNSDIVASTYHIPSYKVIGTAPSSDNVGALEQQYYNQCLQHYIESIEISLDRGLKLSEGVETRFDLDGLLRMDGKSLIESLSSAVKGGIMPPNVALKKQNLRNVAGGDTVYMQQQMFSLEALSKRDARNDPFSNSVTSNTQVRSYQEDESVDAFKALIQIRKDLNRVEYNVQ